MAASARRQLSKKASFWSGHIEAWHRSGLGQGACCRQYAPWLRPLCFHVAMCSAQYAAFPQRPSVADAAMVVPPLGLHMPEIVGRVRSVSFDAYNPIPIHG